MSQAEELLNSVSEETTDTVNSIDPSVEPHIIIDENRIITVPDELKRIGVQYDHNIETVTFDCPRYWDGHDLSEMTFYINYARSDAKIGRYLVDNVQIDETDYTIIHFDWCISHHVTEVKGTLHFLVCANTVDEEGVEERHWNTELNNEMYISEGLECNENIQIIYPDIYTQLLNRMTDNEVTVSEFVDNAKLYADESKSYAVGTNNIFRPDDETDNAKYYYEQIKEFTKGDRGSRWTVGTAITGESTEPTIFETGIADSIVGDKYLNPTTGNIYDCTTEGDASTATWVYSGNLKTREIVDVVNDEFTSESVFETTEYEFNDVIYGNGIFVAVGDGPTNASAIFYSEDGNTWLEANLSEISSLSGTLLAIAYGNGKFIAAGTNGFAYYSEDGINWTKKTSISPSTIIRSVAFGNGKFVAVTEDNSPIWYTENGLSWSASDTSSISTTDLLLRAIVYGNNTFIAFDKSGRILYSEDGIKWTEGTRLTINSDLHDAHAIYANNKFILIGDEGVIYYSENGTTWNSGTGINASHTVRGITYKDGMFFGVADNKTIYTSKDGIKWTGKTYDINYKRIAYGNNMFIAIHSFGTKTILYKLKQLVETRLVASLVAELYKTCTGKDVVITGNLEEFFQLVSDGKMAIAEAITDKGVNTSADVSFTTMATNIAAIPTGLSYEVINGPIVVEYTLL